MEEEKLRATLILEILGRPAENVTNAIKLMIGQLGKEEKVEIISNKVFEPKEVESAKNLFSSFAELEISTDNLERLVAICFRYMPSSIEITHPAEVNINLNDANILLNNLLARLHDYDALAKRMAIENNILLNQLKEAGMKPALQLSPKIKEETKAKSSNNSSSNRKKPKKAKKPGKK